MKRVYEVYGEGELEDMVNANGTLVTNSIDKALNEAHIRSFSILNYPSRRSATSVKIDWYMVPDEWDARGDDLPSSSGTIIDLRVNRA